MTSLRLSEDEHEALVALRLSEGLRSTSDAARAAVRHYVNGRRTGDSGDEIRRKIDELDGEVKRLNHILESFATLTRGD